MHSHEKAEIFKLLLKSKARLYDEHTLIKQAKSKKIEKDVS